MSNILNILFMSMRHGCNIFYFGLYNIPSEYVNNIY